jgi:prepilin-type N-terminal cleavage/methylation domain-containing protein
MKSQRGFTVVELLVASAIMLVVLGAVTKVLHDGVLRAPVLEESSDLQQRSRVVIDLLSAELRRAGAGDDSGPLALYFPALLPRDAVSPPTLAAPSVITVRYAPDGAATARLAAPLLAGDSTVILESGGVCVSNAIACGFTAGTSAVVFDRTGHADTFTVAGIGAGALSVGTHRGPRSSAYGIGATVVEMVEVTFAFDAAARTLTRDENGSAMPVADNLLALDFQYLGIGGRTAEPRPPDSVANCLYAADGTYLHGAPAVTDLQPIPPADLVDGPFCGTGRLAYDVDSLRVRAVRIAIRLDAASDALRGTDGRFFARPGRATSARVIPDIAATFTVTLRNYGR